MYEVDIPTDSEEQGTDQYDCEDSSDVFIDPATEADFARLQRDFFSNYGEHRELAQYVGKPCLPNSLLHPQVLLSAS